MGRFGMWSLKQSERSAVFSSPGCDETTFRFLLISSGFDSSDGAVQRFLCINSAADGGTDETSFL